MGVQCLDARRKLNGSPRAKILRFSGHEVSHGVASVIPSGATAA
jgi:hypothetical protein